MNWFFGHGRIPVLAAIAFATAFFAAQAARVGIESDNVSMNATGGSAAEAHDEFIEDFGDDENVFVSLTFDSGLTAEKLRDVAEFVETVQALRGVRRVLAMTNAPRVVHGELGAEVAPWFESSAAGIEMSEPEFATRIAAEPAYTGILVSYDRKSAAVIVEPDAAAPADTRAAIVDSLLAMSKVWAGRGIRVRPVGIGVEKYEVARLVERDQAILIPAAVGVLCAVLYWFGGTATGALLPIAVTGIALAWTLGLLHLAGFELNPVTSLLPPIVMVLSVATSVHLYYGWLEPIGEASAEARAREALKRLWKPCALTAATTALGLLSLCASGTPAVRQFGGFAAVGVVVSFVAGIAIVPLWLSHASMRATAGSRSRLRSALSACSRVALAAPRLVVASALLLLCLAAVGVSLVRSNTDLVRFLRDDSQLRLDTEFVDGAFAGTTSLELIISKRDGSAMIRPDDVSRMKRLREKLVATTRFRHVTTILDVLGPIHRAENPQQPEALPTDPRELAYLFDLFASSAEPDSFRRFAAPEFTRLRVTLRGPSIGSAQAALSVAEIEAAAHAILGDEYEVVATGTFYRVSQESDRIVADQVRSFALAFALVALAIGVVFRSRRLLVSSLLPNLVPIVSVLGIMGFAGIDLSTGTAMVAAVVIGTAVDDTIHYLARFRREYRGDVRAAVTEANAGTGVAMTVTSVVLILGFWVGAMGSFKPTVYFSILSGATMLIALLCDLIVLPACLVLAFEKTERRTHS